MDATTESDSNEDDFQSTSYGINVRNAPAFVSWQDSRDKRQSLTDLQLSLVFDPVSRRALVKLQTSTRLKKGPCKPAIFLFIKPSQIQTLDCIDSTGDHLDGTDMDQSYHAQEKLGTSTLALRFLLRSPPTFVVPTEYPYRYFRAGSQATWKSWKDFARDTQRFVIFTPAKTLSRARLTAFCRAASTQGMLASLDNDITSLYAGKGGRIIDPDSDDSKTDQKAEDFVPSSAAPPAYEEHVVSLSPSARSPLLCLSPEPPKSRKRPRQNNTIESYNDTTGGTDAILANEKIFQVISQLQQSIDRGHASQEATLAKILAKVDQIECRISCLEEQQRSLAEEVETHVEPLWDELSARLQSQEDREHDYIRDIIEEAFDEKMDEKIPEAIQDYLKNDDEGHTLVSEAVSEKIREDTRDFLRRQHFTGHFTIIDNE